MSAYIASKGGVVGFTRALASEAGPHGITVNCVTPGLIETEGAMEEDPTGELFTEIVGGQAVARRGRPRTSPRWSPTWRARLLASSPARPSTWTAATAITKETA
jgi:NAD(P)-dependent dehydrogenase (short-subunit alcohol dehydrogenase family)